MNFGWEKRERRNEKVREKVLGWKQWKTEGGNKARRAGALRKLDVKCAL